MDNSKKMKTLHLEKRGILDGTSNITGQPVQSLLEPRHSTINLGKHLNMVSYSRVFYVIEFWQKLACHVVLHFRKV